MGHFAINIPSPAPSLPPPMLLSPAGTQTLGWEPARFDWDCRRRLACKCLVCAAMRTVFTDSILDDNNQITIMFSIPYKVIIIFIVVRWWRAELLYDLKTTGKYLASRISWNYMYSIGTCNYQIIISTNYYRKTYCKVVSCSEQLFCSKCFHLRENRNCNVEFTKSCFLWNKNRKKKHETVFCCFSKMWAQVSLMIYFLKNRGLNWTYMYVTKYKYCNFPSTLTP